MTRRLAFLVILGFFSSTFAAPQEYLRAVLRSSALQTIKEASGGESTDIVSIEHTETFRCPGCFEFKMKFYDSASRNGPLRIATFKTENFSGSKIKVTGKLEKGTENLVGVRFSRAFKAQPLGAPHEMLFTHSLIFEDDNIVIDSAASFFGNQPERCTYVVKLTQPLEICVTCASSQTDYIWNGNTLISKDGLKFTKVRDATM